ncbi:MAG: hypothetical protein ACR2NA_08750 [Solirubrobacterales bacterium]
MARVLALAPELMLASKLSSTLRAAGHEVDVLSAAPDAWPEAELAVCDLTAIDPSALPASPPLLLGVYPHVDVELRRSAEAAGFDLVVPRSRMARELPELVERLLAERAGPSPASSPEPTR